MNHNYYIFSKRLLLRPLRMSDLEWVRQWRNQAHIRSLFQDSRPIEAHEQLLWYERYEQQPDDMMFLVTCRKDYTPLGTAAIYHVDLNVGTAELGRIQIGPADVIGQGYGTEIVQAMLSFAWNVLHLYAVELYVKNDNEQAIRTSIACRFTLINDDIVQETTKGSFLKMTMYANTFKGLP
ncbi:GNAT family N-acetyltransferase [Paenibacillus sp. 481]|uniref:GNAT family N-acetyltransferase n=1 Tax=Paenibacillus sp. 481 TaxID=2835869 RepID=UPI001E377DD2|nr:GNAT family N-acetyltransferase [Paenibacillus sp. 481]UHA72559.1 GNAT family N-acetyltransferase [Paenibacillus sp. 481]